MIKINLLDNIPLEDYPRNILKTYSDNSINYLAKRALDQKDYAGLKNILSVMNYFYSIIDHVIAELDVQAAELVANRIKDISENRTTFETSSVKKLFDFDSLGEKVYFSNFSKEELFEKKKKIFQLFLEIINKDSLDSFILIQLALISNEEYFYNFCKDKDIDLEDKKFKDLKDFLSIYTLINLKPLVNLEGKNLTISNLLLSRTYSDELSITEVENIYYNLYNLSPISREMIRYTASLISQNNAIKILFTKGVSGSYLPNQNLILVDSAFAEEAIFNIESVTIHEIGHFVYEQIFTNGALPFNFTEIISLVHDAMNSFKKERANDPYNILSYRHNYALNEFNQTNEGLKLPYTSTDVTMTVDSTHRLVNVTLEYEEAAKKIINKAAELIHFNINQYSKYLFTQEYTEFFKANSFIDLFSLNHYLSTDMNSSDYLISDMVFDNIFMIYSSQQNTCPWGFIEISRSEILRWAEEEFLPKLVAEFKLTPTQIHFLTRISDYLNRGEHLLADKFEEGNFIILSDEKYKELIVRCPEFRAAGIEEDIIDACKELEAYHMKYVSPSLNEFINASGMNSIIFSDTNCQSYSD